MPQANPPPSEPATPHQKITPYRQVAALCLRRSQADTQVLLITSRDTGRWIIPKGWPIKGLKDSEAAAQEAWEEAGVRSADVTEHPIGTYTYDKVLKNGRIKPICAAIYMTKVAELADNYPERKQRTRRWFDLSEAATRVREPRLQQVFQQVSKTLPAYADQI
ncbi:MAG: NUDIX hydrolase [Roseobacter sp.]